jgi:hypothetical protein
VWCCAESRCPRPKGVPLGRDGEMVKGLLSCDARGGLAKIPERIGGFHLYLFSISDC